MDKNDVERIHTRFDSLHEIVSDVRETVGALQTSREVTEDAVLQHAARISSLEKSRAWLLGAAAIIGASATGAVQKVSNLFGP